MMDNRGRVSCDTSWIAVGFVVLGIVMMVVVLAIFLSNLPAV